uniref:Transposase Tc1-like domain-containing protein n=1 Tax=Oncorhynchus tshawytscha TaxID=74940 RepID=A0AAZ3NRP7_ONCTS
MYFKTYLQSQFKINQPRPQKTNCRPPQTIVCKYKHHGTTHPSYRSGTLVRKVKINPRTTAKDLVKMLEETSTKVSISTVKRVLYQHNLKDCSVRKKPLVQKPDYSLQLHKETKIVLFLRNVL